MATRRGAVYIHGRHTASQPGDELVGGWPREKLEKMDARFRSRLEHAIANGREHAPMLHLTGQQIALLRELAAPLSPKQRRGFLDLVMKYLAGCEVGDATVHMAGLRAQTELRRQEPWLSR